VLLLGDGNVLTQAAAATWLFRRDVEIEAASMFNSMAEAMRRFSWPRALANAAAQAAQDEIHHATLCQELVLSLDSEHTVHEMPDMRKYVFQSEDALLYTAVSVGCVTESMSTALLLRMRETTTHSHCNKVVRKVLQDEIGHSRIGWEALRYCSGNRSLRWIYRSLPAMCQNARAEHIEESTSVGDLSQYGILPAPEAKEILDQTELEVIIPGMHSLIGDNCDEQQSVQ